MCVCVFCVCVCVRACVCVCTCLCYIVWTKCPHKDSKTGVGGGVVNYVCLYESVTMQTGFL